MTTIEDYLIASYVINTSPLSVPQPQLINMNILENSIDFGIYVDDPLGIIIQDSIVANLYLGDTVITSDISDLYFNVYVSNLFANKSFRIELLADYDLNDGDPIPHLQQVIYDQEFSTLENFKPVVTIDDIYDTQGYLFVDLEVNDANNTLIGNLWANLYETGSVAPVKTIYFDADETQLVFDYITVAENNYYIEIFASYNLRDGGQPKLNQSLIPSVLVPVEPKAPILSLFRYLFFF